MGTVLEEADECAYWLELLIESAKISAAEVAPLLREAHELAAISVSSIQTARRAR
jgi:four helix bundle protein